MRWWKWAAGTIVVGALLALATVWGLLMANVIEWGAAEEDFAAEQLIVVNRYPELTDEKHSVRVCVEYTAPGENQRRCRLVRFDDDGEMIEEYESDWECYDAARIGDPLPDCWR